MIDTGLTLSVSNLCRYQFLNCIIMIILLVYKHTDTDFDIIPRMSIDAMLTIGHQRNNNKVACICNASQICQENWTPWTELNRVWSPLVLL